MSSISDSEEVDHFQQLNVSLLELFTGTFQTVSIPRKVFNPDGTYVEELHQHQVRIPPGTFHNSIIIAYGAGDIYPDQPPENVPLVVKQQAHEDIARASNGVDLIMSVPITYRESISGNLEFRLMLLDFSIIEVYITGALLLDGAAYIVPGQGMPYPDDRTRRGNLIIVFEIHYPRLTSVGQRIFRRDF